MTIQEVIEAQAKNYRVSPLDVVELAGWNRDMEDANASAEEVREAFARHRRDTSQDDRGRMAGEFWPKAARILWHLGELRREAVAKARPSRSSHGCINPACSSGWVVSHYNEKKVPFMKRCPDCHPEAARRA